MRYWKWKYACCHFGSNKTRELSPLPKNAYDASQVSIRNKIFALSTNIMHQPWEKKNQNYTT